SGSGNGTVMLSAAPNGGGTRTATVSVAGLSFAATQNAANCSYSISPSGQARSTTATIAGQPFAVSEPAPSCVYTLTPASQTLAPSAATISVGVATSAWCSWTAQIGRASCG